MKKLMVWLKYGHHELKEQNLTKCYKFDNI